MDPTLASYVGKFPRECVMMLMALYLLHLFSVAMRIIKKIRWYHMDALALALLILLDAFAGMQESK